ncbi:MAG: valine--tRNA ligase, partial [bacterium]
SVDWSREAFTMDEARSRAVRHAFVHLYKKRLIYRGKRIVNWCPRCLTAISDIEVEHREVEGKLYFVKYPIKDGGGAITIATTRPETILADVAVAVNPEDKRYNGRIGTTALLPIPGMPRELPIIGDAAVDKEFGTGALKITPAHDPVDFEIGQRHGLKMVECLDEKAQVPGEWEGQSFGRYKGMDRFQARKAVVEDLHAAGLVEKEESYSHSVGHCSRCDTMVEPRLSFQWFLKMRPLADAALEAMRTGKGPTFVPEQRANEYGRWLTDIRDWCISRQLWWGHRIPVWRCETCNSYIASVADPDACDNCNGTKLVAEEDVLDTWFSSGLWPFSVFGWPDETEDLKRFYPTSVLVTGYDIITFWVSRMVIFGLEFTGQAPFREVYIHGLIRDISGRKMSKSGGNVIDPLEVIEDVGIDSLRFAFGYAIPKGQDILLSKDKLDGARKFMNKLWNASRLLLSYTEAKSAPGSPPEVNETMDRWIVSRLSGTAATVTREMDAYRFREATHAIYEFVWGDFCDWYLEALKPRLRSDEAKVKREALACGLFVLRHILKLLHPFAPYVTEELWRHLPGSSGLLAHADWKFPILLDAEAEAWFSRLSETVRAVRALKTDLGIPSAQKVDVFAEGFSDSDPALIAHLAFVKEIHTVPPAAPPKMALVTVAGKTRWMLPVAQQDHIATKIEGTQKEIETLEGRIRKLEGRLNDGKFVRSAPEDVVQSVRNSAAHLKQDLQAAQERLARLTSAL